MLRLSPPRKTHLKHFLRDRGLDERLILVARLLDALNAFHENEPGSRPALDPDCVEVAGDECRLEPAPRALGPTTASYRAPETNEGAPYAPSADTFSMGVLCYEVLAGRHPFLVETSHGTLEPLTILPATPLRDVSPEVPRDLADALMACLERDPEWRAKDISYLSEVAQRLRPAKTARSTARKPAPAAAVPARGVSAAAARGSSLPSLTPAAPGPKGSRRIYEMKDYHGCNDPAEAHEKGLLTEISVSGMQIMLDQGLNA